MNTNRYKITFDNAILKLQENTDIKVQKKLMPVNLQTNNFPDMILEINVDGVKKEFFVECKAQLRNDKLPQLLALKKRYDNLMVITDKFYPNIVETLKKNEIAYLDNTGAAYIKAKGIRVIKDGDPNIEIPIFERNDLTPTGVIFAFYLLYDDKFINKNYREMADICDTALGNIYKIVNHLRNQRYLVRLRKTGLKIIEKRNLLDYWVEQYAKILKPKLFIAKFRFPYARDFNDWKEIGGPPNIIIGGEAAAEFITHYLKAAIITLYTLDTKIDLIKKFAIVPDDKEGYIEVYKKFWKAKGKEILFTPHLLTYADLMNTGDPRNIEAAQIIYNETLKEKF